MPEKYSDKKDWNVSKQKYNVSKDRAWNNFLFLVESVKSANQYIKTDFHEKILRTRQGVVIEEEDASRLSPLGRKHINFLGHFSLSPYQK